MPNGNHFDGARTEEQFRLEVTFFGKKLLFGPRLSALLWACFRRTCVPRGLSYVLHRGTDSIEPLFASMSDAQDSISAYYCVNSRVPLHQLYKPGQDSAEKRSVDKYGESTDNTKTPRWHAFSRGSPQRIALVVGCPSPCFSYYTVAVVRA